MAFQGNGFLVEALFAKEGAEVACDNGVILAFLGKIAFKNLEGLFVIGHGLLELLEFVRHRGDQVVLQARQSHLAGEAAAEKECERRDGGIGGGGASGSW